MSLPAVMERALILAPHGRDAAVASALLGEAGIAAHACPDLPALCAALEDGAGLLILVEEAVRTADLQGLVAWIGAQPPWSDLPVILLTLRGDGAERTPEAARLTELLGNVTFVERPFHPTTLISVVRTCLRGRRRQYEARARLAERERLLAELADERARFETLVEHLPVAVNLMDLNGRTILSNPAFRRFFPDSVIPSQRPDGEESWIGYDEQGRRLARDQYVAMRALRGETVSGIEFIYHPAGGQPVWTRVSGVPVQDSTGKTTGALAVIVDISDQKAAQEALQRLTATLETKVQERTRELAATLDQLRDEIRDRERAEEQLRQTQKLETLGQLTGGVAHDFNNLLTVVLGNIDMLARKQEEEPRRARRIDAIRQAAERGRDLTRQLLAFSRRQHLSPVTLDVNALIHDFAPLMR
ncbi:PAS domain S-box protein, partial [Azospirillum sp.]|uniref:PAS domain S-box protein n=1 Tax=Azospirillum sp. TaxID=34012 RepID=UPI002D233CD7